MNVQGIIQRLRRMSLRSRGVKIGKTSIVGPSISFGQDHHPKINGFVCIGNECQLNKGIELNPWGGSIVVDDRVWIGPYVVIYGHGGVCIGKDCLISMHCRILSSNHTIPPVGIPIRSQPDVFKPTIIEDDVWVGAGATVLAGVCLHQGAIIGAGSVVTNDIPANAIAVGVPARVIRYRPTESAAGVEL